MKMRRSGVKLGAWVLAACFGALTPIDRKVINGTVKTAAKVRRNIWAAAPRLRTLDERTLGLEEDLAHLGKRLEDTIAILRSVEQVILARLDGQAQVLEPLVRMTTLTTFRMQAVVEHHPKAEVQQRFRDLIREAGL